MQKELRKLQLAQKEHLRKQRELHSQEIQLRALRNELSELKGIKAKLIRKMHEESNRHKEEETRKSREIAQLKKESRKQQNTIKSLQAQGAAKDQILKRRTEQVTALRKNQKGVLSLKASGRVPPKKKESLVFSPRQVRIKWDNLQRTIGRAARSKQVVVQLEHELERLISERENLSKDLINVRNKQKYINSLDLANEEDTLKANLNYIQENIEHVQQAIMEFEEGKESSNDTQNLQSLIENVKTVDEAKFLLEKLSQIAISQTCDTSLAQTKLLEREALLKDIQQENGIQQQLLQHFLTQNPSVQITDLFDSLNLSSTNSINTVNSNSTFDIPSTTNNLTSSNIESTNQTSRSPSPAPTVDL